MKQGRTHAPAAERRIIMAKANETAAKVETTNRVKYRVPKGSSKEDPNLFVAINGKTYLIPRGVEVEIPDFVAAEIERSNAARDGFYETVEELAAKPGK